MSRMTSISILVLFATSRSTTRTSGWIPRSIFTQLEHVPQPPDGRFGSRQLSVCAKRIATVRLPMERGPNSP